MTVGGEARDKEHPAGQTKELSEDCSQHSKSESLHAGSQKESEHMIPDFGWRIILRLRVFGV